MISLPVFARLLRFAFLHHVSVERHRGDQRIQVQVFIDPVDGRDLTVIRKEGQETQALVADPVKEPGVRRTGEQIRRRHCIREDRFHGFADQGISVLRIVRDPGRAAGIQHLHLQIIFFRQFPDGVEGTLLPLVV